MMERKRRRRLDADAARTLILDVAEKQLAAVGPSGIRLQEVAADAGVSHPTVLHHFGSREQLVRAVIARSLDAINTNLIEAMRAARGDEEQLESLLENVGNVLQESGHARVVMWLALEGHRVNAINAPLGTVVDAAHSLRLELMGPKRTNPPSREDTARTVALTTLALLGCAVVGPMVLENAGLGDSPQEMKKFRTWMAHVVLDYLNRGAREGIGPLGE